MPVMAFPARSILRNLELACVTAGRHPGRMAPLVVGTRRVPWKGGPSGAVWPKGGRRRPVPAREWRCGGWSRPVPLASRCREPGRAGGYGFPARSMLINQDLAGKSRRGRRVRRKVAGICGAVALRPRGAVSSGHFSPDPSCAIMNDQDRAGYRRGRPMPVLMGRPTSEGPQPGGVPLWTAALIGCKRPCDASGRAAKTRHQGR